MFKTCHWLAICTCNTNSSLKPAFLAIIFHRKLHTPIDAIPFVAMPCYARKPHPPDATQCSICYSFASQDDAVNAFILYHFIYFGLGTPTMPYRFLSFPLAV